MSKQRGERMNVFGGGDDLQTVADEIYGKSEVPDSGRVVARPTPIGEIWADVRQPRRAIPLSIRMHWNGDPSDVPALLRQWAAVAANQAGVSIDVEAVLKGEGDGIDSDKFPSVAQEFIALARLAQGIRADGLINPITIVESDGRLLIESGERRWLAYHLLRLHLGEEWAKIPAAKGSGSDSVWRQATENTARRQLNPIGMARQLALLIMAARGTPPIESGSPYREYDEIVKAGTSDRRYYAQVADGNVHRIPRGMGERIQGAMGLSMEQLSRYRALLRLTDDEQVNDALWVRADVENWAEHTIRDIATLPMGKVRAVIERDGWTLDDLRALKDVPVAVPPSVQAPAPPVPQRPPVTSEWMHKTVRTPGGQMGKVVGVDGDWITISLEPTGKRQSFLERNLTVIASQMGTAPVTPAPSPAAPFAIGDKVRTRTGTEGEVVGIGGRLVSVRTKNGTTNHDYSLLTKLPPVESTPVITEDMIEPDVDPDAPQLPREYSEGGVAESGGTAPHPAFAFLDKRVRLENGLTGVVRTVETEWLVVTLDQGGTRMSHYSEVTEIGHELPEIDTDKADSESETEEPEDIFGYSSSEFDFLDELQDVALSVKNEAASEVLGWLANIEDVTAIQYQQEGILKPKLDECFDIIKAAMDEWLQVNLPAILQKIMDVGNRQ